MMSELVVGLASLQAADDVSGQRQYGSVGATGGRSL